MFCSVTVTANLELFHAKQTFIMPHKELAEYNGSRDDRYVVYHPNYLIERWRHRTSDVRRRLLLIGHSNGVIRTRCVDVCGLPGLACCATISVWLQSRTLQLQFEIYQVGLVNSFDTRVVRTDLLMHIFREQNY
jgi:hypothetical protein